MPVSRNDPAFDVASLEMNPRTADPDQSIWRDLPEDAFREHLVQLEERTNAVPIDAQRFSATTLNNPDRDSHLLSVNDEQSLADAFAFLAAVEEGAQSVAAVCLEEDIQNTILTVRFAAVDTISELLQHALHKVTEVLSRDVDTASDDNLRSNELFQLITKLHFQRLLGRLRSSRWTKPNFLSRSHKKPLWQDFANLIHRVQFLYTKQESFTRQSLEKQLKPLAELYSLFETTALNSDEQLAHLTHLIRTSYDCCTDYGMKDYTQRLRCAGQTSQVRSALKTLQQIEKIAAYYRVANTLISVSQRYVCYFQHKQPRLVYLSPYACVPTCIGYEEWAKTSHIHAEIQLIVHYDMQSPSGSTSNDTTTSLPPRVIGTSKYLCYLCYRFMEKHGRFPPANTHGRLYDQWTIPDLAAFSDEQRSRYRYIIQEMDKDVVARAARSPLWRPEPMTSRENLLDAVQDASINVL